MFDSNETLEQARARNIRDALQEDIGRCDWTARLVPAGQRVKARVLVREAAVLCGREWFEGCFMALDRQARIDWHYADGTLMHADTPVCHIEADARAKRGAVLQQRRHAIEIADRTVVLDLYAGDLPR